MTAPGQPGGFQLTPGLIKAMIELTPAGYHVVDSQYRLRYANGYVCSFLGVSPADIAGRLCYDVIHHGQPCPDCPVRQVWQDGLPHRLPLRKNTRPDGAALYLEERSLPLFNDEGKLEHVLTIFLNRTRPVRLQKRSDGVFYELVRSLVSILEKKDPYTSEHSANVSVLSARLAKFMAVPDDLAYKVYLGALLHDIGKVLVPDAIINKRARLTEAEYEDVKRHPVESFNLLAHLKGEGFEEVRDICRHHHERWDGSGYPDGLAGPEIPLGSQIIALADSYDAMTSDRPYRLGMSHEAALKNIRDGLGTQFSPEAGEKFLEMATLYFTNRDQILAQDVTAIDSYIRYLDRDGQGLAERYVGPKEGLGLGRWGAGQRFPLDDALASRIFRRTPAYYSIIDKSMRIVFASDSLFRATGRKPADLAGRKCYEYEEKPADCFMGGDGLMCAGLRALYNGTVERCETDETWQGAQRSFDLCATAIDVGGERHILEVMFDRTKEVAARRKLAADCRAIIAMLQGLIARIDPEETGNSEALIDECVTRGDYFAHLEDYEDLFNHDGPRGLEGAKP